MSDADPVQRERMRRALAVLPEPEREVFRLHALEALDYGTIAKRLDLGVREVEEALARAICLIDRELRRQPPGADHERGRSLWALRRRASRIRP
jgi:DNA-directed RNA polymerase specialized sigma24 family protein